MDATIVGAAIGVAGGVIGALLAGGHQRCGRGRALPQGDDDQVARVAFRADQPRSEVSEQHLRSEALEQLRQVDAPRLAASVAAGAVHDELDRLREREIVRGL